MNEPRRAADSPEISVVTPSFRQLEWLKLCAASVADQEGVRVEHVVQDAGTGPELEAWAAGRPGLKLFVEKDSGMYDAINRGFKRTTAPICAYLNCDEQYLPGTLATVARFFAEHPQVDVLCGDFVLTDNHGRALSYRRVVTPRRWHTRLCHLGVATCAIFFRRKLIEQGFLFRPDLRIVGDAEWICRLLDVGFRFAVLPQPLSVFAMTGTNLSVLEIAVQEQAVFSPRLGPVLPVARLAGRAVNFARKLLAGAYVPRKLDYAIYTHESPVRRVAFTGQRPGTGWSRG